MSFDLYAWKRPVVESEDEALALIEGEKGAFEASPDVQDFYDEVLRRWPAEPLTRVRSTVARPPGPSRRSPRTGSWS